MVVNHILESPIVFWNILDFDHIRLVGLATTQDSLLQALAYCARVFIDAFVEHALLRGIVENVVVQPSVAAIVAEITGAIDNLLF